MTITLLPVHRGAPLDLEEYGLRPLFPQVLDSSMLKDFMYCPSYFYLRHVLGLRPKKYDISEDAGRDWGTIWHSVHERFNHALIEDGGLDDAVTAGLSAMEPWPASIKAETDKHGRSQERMIRIFFEYVDRYTPKDLKDFEIIRLEQFFDLYDEDFDIRWCGRMDRVVRRKRTGKICPWDYKTTSYMTKFFFEQFEFSFQFPGYVRMLSHILTESIDEIITDVLYTLKASHDFFRRTMRYSPEAIQEWGINTRNILDWIYWLRDNHLYNPSAWIQNRNHCTSWNKACMFADVHWNDPRPGTRLKILRDNYVEDRWDPLRESPEDDN